MLGDTTDLKSVHAEDEDMGPGMLKEFGIHWSELEQLALVVPQTSITQFS